MRNPKFLHYRYKGYADIHIKNADVTKNSLSSLLKVLGLYETQVIIAIFETIAEADTELFQMRKSLKRYTTTSGALVVACKKEDFKFLLNHINKDNLDGLFMADTNVDSQISNMTEESLKK